MLQKLTSWANELRAKYNNYQQDLVEKMMNSKARFVGAAFVATDAIIDTIMMLAVVIGILMTVSAVIGLLVNPVGLTVILSIAGAAAIGLIIYNFTQFLTKLGALRKNKDDITTKETELEIKRAELQAIRKKITALRQDPENKKLDILGIKEKEKDESLKPANSSLKPSLSKISKFRQFFSLFSNVASVADFFRSLVSAVQFIAVTMGMNVAKMSLLTIFITVTGLAAPAGIAVAAVITLGFGVAKLCSNFFNGVTDRYKESQEEKLNNINNQLQDIMPEKIKSANKKYEDLKSRISAAKKIEKLTVAISAFRQQPQQPQITCHHSYRRRKNTGSAPTLGYSSDGSSLGYETDAGEFGGVQTSVTRAYVGYNTAEPAHLSFVSPLSSNGFSATA